jgi:hypothetical protein
MVVFLETKSFEIEGITTKVSKKEYKTDWIVNKETDLDETQKNIAIAEKKIKLSKAEQKEIKQRNREIVRDQKVQDQTKYEAQRKEAKEFKKDKSTLKMHEKKLEANHKATKFIPGRNK